jgi:ribosomal protein L10
MLLLKIDELFAKETLLITHSMKRRKLIRQIEKLQKRKRKEDKVRIKETYFYTCNSYQCLCYRHI